MLIPLDYYRILGLPIQTGDEQLQQAYHDRSLQLPRREYSPAAIEARKQLLEAAYTVLSNPEQRQRYDANYFAHTYESEANNFAQTIDADYPEVVQSAIDPHTPTIEIADEQFVGALLILQELGEYELVLNLGLPFLNVNSARFRQGQGDVNDLVLSDIILTVALAYLELGREQWQQNQYENAANSLEYGKNLLFSEQLFPSVAAEIKADLDKLRPYRVLELLSRSEDDVTARQHGLQLLQDMLQERQGIDGTGEDGSGLSVEDFLRFIQQLRSYLTAAEQQNLFEAESQRPSAVATYLAIYSLIGRGFAQRMPVLIRQAKLMLMRLGKRQDLYLEQGICALLLGQTTEASRAIELSQEYEPLAFIQEHSQGSPDLLPGLCLYSERWLQTDVFPHFRDLAQQQASLKEYFADEQVQAYLEALPTQLEATDEWVALEESQPLTVESQKSHARQISDTAVAAQSSFTSNREQQRLQFARSVQQASSSEISERSPLTTAASGVAVLPATEQSARTTALEKVQTPPQRPRRRKRSQSAHGSGMDENESMLIEQQDSLAIARGHTPRVKKTRLTLLLIGSVLGIAILWLLASQVYGWFRQIFSPAPVLPGEQLIVQLDRPPVPIPTPSPQQPAATEPLNQATATVVIERWLSTKAAAFGPQYAVNQLKQILAEPVLSQWQQRAKIDQASNRYRQYQHGVKVNSVKTNSSTSDRAQVEAVVKEVAQVYQNGKLNRNASYNEDVRVRYNLVRQNGQWRIREMTVLN